jgi:outer membrane protein assembly factor BamB
MPGRKTLAIIFCAWCVSTQVQGGDWTQFRGPNNSGLSAESQAPSEWSIEKNLAWKEKIPGYGWSSPIIVGDKIFVTTAITENQKRPRPMYFPGGDGGSIPPPLPPGGQGGPRRPMGPPGGGFGGPGMFGNAKPPDAVYRWEIHCLDRNTGKTIWSRKPLERKPTIAALMGNTYASETPVSDGERIYAYFGMHGLYCYDLSGNQLWGKDLGASKMLMGWGTGSSPALDGDRLFILCDNEEKSFIAAFDKKTGNELWRVARKEKSNWATPFVWHNNVRTEVVASGGAAVRAYDPADGKVLWEISEPVRAGRNPMPATTSATPVGDEEMLYVGHGNPMGGSPLWAVKAGASGDISLKQGETANSSIVWSSNRAGPPMASPLLYKDHLYILAQNGGLLSCYDAKTGKETYKERLKGARGFTSSPWANDDKVYCLDQDGQTFVVQAGPLFKLLGKNSIQDMFWSSPAVARDAFYLRGADQLYCIRRLDSKALE